MCVYVREKMCVCLCVCKNVCQGRKEMLYLTMYSTHFIYGYMVLDIW